MYPTTNILFRVFNVRVTGSSGRVLSAGTMFGIDVNGRQYFVTARHIGEHMMGRKVEVMRNGIWNSYDLEIVGHGDGSVDVSVIALPDNLIPEDSRFPLPTTFQGATLGEEMMFLGFPWRLRHFHWVQSPQRVFRYP